MGQCLPIAAFCYFIFITVLSGVIATGILVYLLFTSYFWITLVYLLWYAYDFRTCHRGGYQCRYGLYLLPTQYMRDYFPVSLVKTADVDCGQNYIFCVHPHGALCFGGAINFATDSTGFSKLFPGIRPRLMTLRYNFLVPFGKELQLASGCCAASKEGIANILRREDKGNAAVLVVGGIPEQDYAYPGKMEFYLENRKGFVKLALKHGAHLVPVINFGENDIIQIDSRSGKKLFRVPLRKPIISVVGKPIPVDKVEEPTSEQILSLHRKYCDALTELYDERKEEYGFKDIPLVIK